jgi:hypothetical protein
VKFNQGLANFDTKHCIPNKLEIRHGRFLREKQNLRTRDANIHVSWKDMLGQLVIFAVVSEGYSVFLFILN